MQLFFTILKNDLKLIFRDKSLVVMFIVPVAIVCLCRFGIPHLAEFYPVLPDYYWLIVAVLTSVTASTPSYLIGFILLDERDENVHTMLRILPVPENFILRIRIALMVFLGFIFSVFILLLNGLIRPDFFQILAVSILFSLIPPVLTFSITAFAKNKIEAATLYKGLNILLFIPVFAFFIESPLKLLMGIIPFYWTFETMHNITLSSPFYFDILIGAVLHSAFIILLYKTYKNRIF